MTVEQKAILEVLAFSLGKKKTDLCLDKLDMNKLFEEAKLQSVLPSVFDGLDKLGFAQFDNLELTILYEQMIANNLRILAEHESIEKLMSEAKIPYCILKGAASAKYYPEPYLRSMGDVDFYVSHEDIKKASQLMIEHGYATVDHKSDIHMTFRKGTSVVEAHDCINGIPEAEAGKIIGKWCESIIDDSVEYDSDFGKCRVPCDFHHGIIILLHMLHHLVANGIGLRHLCDWAAFVNTFEADSFAEMFEQKLTQVGLWHSAQLLSLTCVKYLSTEYEKWMGEDNEGFCDGLMEDILTGGNFGRKDEVHSHSSLFTSSYGRDGKSQSWFSSGISAINAKTYTAHPFIKKHKIFLPIGWLLFLCEYIRRRFGKKKKVPSISKAVKRSNERRSLLNKLELYKL